MIIIVIIIILGANHTEKCFCKALCSEKRYTNVLMQYKQNQTRLPNCVIKTDIQIALLMISDLSSPEPITEEVMASP